MLFLPRLMRAALATFSARSASARSAVMAILPSSRARRASIEATYENQGRQGKRMDSCTTKAKKRKSRSDTLQSSAKVHNRSGRCILRFTSIAVCVATSEEELLEAFEIFAWRTASIRA